MNKQAADNKGVTVTIMPKGYVPTQDEQNRRAQIIMGEDSVDRRLTEEGKSQCMVVDNGDGTSSIQIGAFTGSTPKVLVSRNGHIYSGLVREDERQFRLENVRLSEQRAHPEDAGKLLKKD